MTLQHGERTAATPPAVDQGPAWAPPIAVRAQRDWAELRAAREGTSTDMASVETLLTEAVSVATMPGSLRQWWRGSRQHLALMRVHEAEAEITLLLSGDELAAHAQDLLVLAGRLLRPDDPRVCAVRKALADPPHVPSAAAVAHLGRAVHDEEAERYAQSRGFRNRLIRLIGVAVVALAVLTLAFGLNILPMPVTDPTRHLETGLLVGLFGAIGALIVGVPPLARIGGTWNPFSLPWYQMLLKIALGPVFAIVGVLMLASGLIPNVATPMALPDLLVWALAFGAGQQAVTTAVDKRVKGLVADTSQTQRSASARAQGTSTPD